MDQEHGIVKASLAWLGVGLSKLGIHGWSDMAAVVTTIFTLLLIFDWCLKKWRKRRGD